MPETFKPPPRVLSPPPDLVRWMRWVEAFVAKLVREGGPKIALRAGDIGAGAVNGNALAQGAVGPGSLGWGAFDLSVITGAIIQSDTAAAGVNRLVIDDHGIHFYDNFGVTVLDQDIASMMSIMQDLLITGTTTMTNGGRTATWRNDGDATFLTDDNILFDEWQTVSSTETIGGQSCAIEVDCRVTYDRLVDLRYSMIWTTAPSTLAFTTTAFLPVNALPDASPNALPVFGNALAKLGAAQVPLACSLSAGTIVMNSTATNPSAYTSISGSFHYSIAK